MIYWFELLLFAQWIEATAEIREHKLRSVPECTFHTSAAYEIESLKARGQYPVVFLQKYYMAEISAEA